MFALHRIKEYKVLETTFEPVPREELNAWIDSAFQIEHTEREFQVVVKFAAYSARYRKERVASHQSLEDFSDGSCKLSFPASSLDEVARWLAPYGPDAMVLEPPELQKMVIEAARATLQLYEDA